MSHHIDSGDPADFGGPDSPHPMWFDFDENPITFLQWAEAHRAAGYAWRIMVGWVTLVAPRVYVSSRFFGTNIGLTRPGAPPLLYETMVFDVDSDYTNLISPWAFKGFRYHHRDEAVIGHNTVVNAILASPDEFFDPFG